MAKLSRPLLDWQLFQLLFLYLQKSNPYVLRCSYSPIFDCARVHRGWTPSLIQVQQRLEYAGGDKRIGIPAGRNPFRVGDVAGGKTHTVQEKQRAHYRKEARRRTIAIYQCPLRFVH